MAITDIMEYPDGELSMIVENTEADRDFEVEPAPDVTYQALLDPAVTQRVIDQVRKSEQDRQAVSFKDLSTREMQILAEVARGKSNRDIAEH